MSIQWFPGHMTKARKVIDESMSMHDVVVEVLDARMPRASENPMVEELRRTRPCLKVLSKSDLADPAITAQWLRYFSDRKEIGSVEAIAITTEKRAETKRKVIELCKKLGAHRAEKDRTVRVMVLGIPNVGKSTLINTLAGRRATEVGDKPAVTKSQQRIEIDRDIALSDNPGIMWPRIDDEKAGLRLAFGGAIPDTALELEPVALFGAKFLLEKYPALVVARYKLKETPATADALIDEIGRRRGGLRPGGVIDRHKASEIFIHDYRTGALGRISLEQPKQPGASASG